MKTTSSSKSFPDYINHFKELKILKANEVQSLLYNLEFYECLVIFQTQKIIGYYLYKIQNIIDWKQYNIDMLELMTKSRYELLMKMLNDFKQSGVSYELLLPIPTAKLMKSISNNHIDVVVEVEVDRNTNDLFSFNNNNNIDNNIIIETTKINEILNVEKVNNYNSNNDNNVYHNVNNININNNKIATMNECENLWEAIQNKRYSIVEIMLQQYSIDLLINIKDAKHNVNYLFKTDKCVCVDCSID